MTKSLKSKITSLGIISCMIGTFSSMIVGYALNANAITINNVPTNIIKAEVTSCDSDYNPTTTNATVSINSGSAKIDNLSNAGYYYVTFFTDVAEVGSVEFYVGESGKIYKYGYENGTEEVFTQVSYLEYQKYPTNRILDISGKNKVKFEDVDSNAVKANIYVSYENGDYGKMETDITVKNNTTTISNIGTQGDYSVEFLDSADTILNFASFFIGQNNEVLIYDYVYDDTSNEWVEKLVSTDMIYADTYDIYLSDIGGTDDSGNSVNNVSISGISKNTSRVDVQAFDLNLNEIFVEPIVAIHSGSIEIGNLYSGCYFINFYNSSDDVIGYSKFYLDENGKSYNYEFSENEPQLNEISSIAYQSVSAEQEYQFGNISVDIYGVPNDIDSVESYYIYGDGTDESILFEPDYSSIFVEPFRLSGLGQSGDYKISFFKDNKVVGNATFSIDSSGKVCEADYVYNDKTGTWDVTLVESDEIYYYENTDIEDADTYNYGNVKFTISNVPSDVKMVYSNYYGNDDTFTYGEPFFPDITIKNGIVSINNLGDSGYYEFELVKEDEMTKVGYVFIYIDENMDTYLYETFINTDVMQLEAKKTKISTAKLSKYASGSVEYSESSYSVTINSVPKVANNILVTVVGENNEYACFEREIIVNKDGTVKLDKLGMNGDYTVTFLVGNDLIGSTRFYLKDGKTYTATYSGNYELNLTTLKNIKFEATDDATEYEIGDVDLNGVISVSDLVLLQRYLLTKTGINASQFNIADMNNDGVVNVFDMCLLKRKLLKIH